MPNERIDHAAKAREWLSGRDGAEYPTTKLEETVAFAAIAQAHATLALVEQQKIANLLVLAKWVVDFGKYDVGLALDDLRILVAGEVWEGLGVSDVD